MLCLKDDSEYEISIQVVSTMRSRTVPTRITYTLEAPPANVSGQAGCKKTPTPNMHPQGALSGGLK